MKFKRTKIDEALDLAFRRYCYAAPVSGKITQAGTGSIPSEIPIGGISPGVYRIIAAITLDDTYAGKCGVFDIAAGVAVTLPRARGTGNVFEFFVKTTVTSVGDKIKVGNAQDVIQGMVMGCQDSGDTVEGWETVAATDTITLDGSLTGGVRGDYIRLQDVADGVYSVSGQITQTGSQATPFSEAVS